MPTYDYQCDKCDKPYEVTKYMSEYDGKDLCPDCGNQGRRLFTCNVYFTGTSVKDAYKCPALGQIIKSDYDRSEAAKRKNVVEIGNDFGSPDKLQTHFETKREEKRKKNWESDE